jgi:SWIM zinc finger
LTRITLRGIINTRERDVPELRKTKGEPNMTTIQMTVTTKYNVTIEQIDRATKIIDCNTNTVYFQVDSQTTPGTAYNARFNPQYGKLTCTCPAGEKGINCWHKRAALAANELEKVTTNLRRKAEQAAIEATEEYQMEQLFRDLEEALDALDRIAEESDEREALRQTLGS